MTVKAELHPLENIRDQIFDPFFPQDRQHDDRVELASVALEAREAGSPMYIVTISRDPEDNITHNNREILLAFNKAVGAQYKSLGYWDGRGQQIRDQDGKLYEISTTSTEPVGDHKWRVIIETE